MELTALKFNVETQRLKDAKDAIDALAASMQKLDAVSQKEVKTAIEVEKLREQEAKTAIQLSKLKQQEVKESEAVTKAKSNETKANEDLDNSSKKVTNTLERQQKILEYMTQGFSKGQSSILATADAAGLAVKELEQLGNVLQTQRKLVGGDPFDKSMSGLVALTNRYGEIREAIRQYNSDAALTREQTRELARDKERLIERMKTEQASFSEIKQAVRSYNSAYTEMASKVNALTQVEKERERASRDRTNALRNVQSAEERLFATVSHINDEMSNNSRLNERAALAIGSYERNLKLAGYSAEESAKKLQAFKVAQQQISEHEAKNRSNYVSRGIGVQMGDVAVSLASGMNPLTVAIQQGDQIRGLLQQSGLAASEMGIVMAQAMKGIITSFRDVGIAIGSFVVGGIKYLGQSVIETAGKVDILKIALKKYSDEGITQAGPPTAEMIKYNKVFNTVMTATGVIVAAAGVSLLAYVGSVIAAIKEHEKLNQAIILHGKSLGITTDAAYAYSKAMNVVGVSQGDTLKVIAEMAKAGNLSKNSIESITIAAVKMKEYGGIAIEETVKSFSELAKEPVKASIKLNDQYKYLTSEIYLQIKAFEEQGQTLKAAELAMSSYSDMIRERTNNISDNLGFLESAWKSISKAAKIAWDEMLGMGRKDPEEEVRKAQATLEGKGYLQGGLAFGGESEARAIIAIYNAKKEAQDELAESQLKSQRAAEGTIELSKIASEYSDKQTKKQLELNQAHNAYAKALAGAAGNTSLQTKLAKEYDIVLNGINEKYKEREKSSKSDNAYASALKTMLDMQIELTRANTDSAKPLEETTKAYAALEKIKDSPKWKTFTAEQKKNLEQIKDENVAIEIRNLRLTAHKKAIEDLKKMRESLSAEEAKNQAAYEAGTKEIDFQYSLIGKTAGEVRQMTIKHEYQAKVMEITVAAEARRVKLMQDYADISKNIDPENLQDIALAQQKFFEGLNQIETDAENKRTLARKKANLDVVQDYYNTLKNYSEQISNAIYDALTGKSKDAAKALRKMIADELKKPIVAAIHVVVSGTLDSAAKFVGIDPATFNSDKGIAGNLLGGASNASSLYTNVLGGGGIFGSSAAYGAAIGTTSIGAGSQAAMLAAQTGEFGLAGTAATAEAAGLASSGTLTALAGAAPYLGAAIAGLTLISKVFGGSGGGPKSEVYGGSRNVDWGLAATGASSEGLDAMAKGIKDTFNTVLTSFGKTAVDLIVGIGGDADPSGKAGTTAGYYLKGGDVTRFNQFSVNDLSGNTFALVAQKALLAALEAADVNSVVDSYLNTLNIGTLTAEQANTAMQVISNLYQLQQTLADLGFGANALSQELVNALGGIDSFQSKMNAFYEGYFTSEEKAARQTKQLEAAFKALGVAMPSSRKEFRDLIMELTNTGGTSATLAGQLINLSDAFGQVADAAEAATQAMLDQVDKARSDLLSAYQNESKTLTETKSKFEDFVKSIGDFRTSLLLGDLSPLDPVAKYEQAKADFTSISTKAQLGDENAIAKLQSSSEAFLNASRAMYSSGLEYNQDFNSVLSVLDSTESLAVRQARIASDSLNELSKQSGILGSIDAGVLTVADAMNALSAALAPLAAQGYVAPAGSSASGMTYKSSAGASYALDTGLWSFIDNGATTPITSRQAKEQALAIMAKDNGPQAIYDAAKRLGVSLTDVNSIMGWRAGEAEAWAKSQGLPSFDIGINRVPNDTLAMVHKDEAIIPAAFNPWAGGSLADNSKVAELIQSLIQEVAELRKQQANESRQQTGATLAAAEYTAEKVSESQREAVWKNQIKEKLVA